MQMICVSRGSYRRGRELAERLANDLGCPCLGREEMIEGAVERGIPVGKLEEAVVKRRPLGDSLALLSERYKAYVTTVLCERALAGSLVYHGRAGHLVLPGVPHLLRVRAITDAEDRYESVMQRLHVTRDKARRYVEDVDEDIHRWVRTLYNLDPNDAALYNFTVNCSKMAIGNVATTLVAAAQLPEFQATPASVQRMENLLLAARCRLALAEDPRTAELHLQVRAERGSVAVTYLPRQARETEAIPAVLTGLDGVVEVRQTIATTTILWVQERFDTESETFTHVLEVAERWNAAVDLVRLVPTGDEAAAATQQHDRLDLSGDDGGILEDGAETAPAGDDGGVAATMDRLVRAGRAGAQCTVCGSQQSLIGNVCSVTDVSLVVLDNLFLEKGAAVRKRLTRDLAGRLADRLRTPVIGPEELKTEYLFGLRQWVRLAAAAGLVAVLYGFVFTHQDAVLGFLRAEGTSARALAATAVAVTAPVVAFLWGSAAQHLLRLFRFE